MRWEPGGAQGFRQARSVSPFLLRFQWLVCDYRRRPRAGIAVAKQVGGNPATEYPTRMLKITTIEESARAVLLKLDGKITAQWAVLLDGICRSYLERQKAVEIDCANVDFIDALGVDVLNAFPSAVLLRDTPTFIRQMLNSGGQS